MGGFAILNHKLFSREFALPAAEATGLNILANLGEIQVIVIFNDLVLAMISEVEDAWHCTFFVSWIMISDVNSVGFGDSSSKIATRVHYLVFLHPSTLIRIWVRFWIRVRFSDSNLIHILGGDSEQKLFVEVNEKICPKCMILGTSGVI